MTDLHILWKRPKYLYGPLDGFEVQIFNNMNDNFTLPGYQNSFIFTINKVHQM